MHMYRATRCSTILIPPQSTVREALDPSHPSNQGWTLEQAASKEPFWSVRTRRSPDSWRIQCAALHEIFLTPPMDRSSSHIQGNTKGVAHPHLGKARHVGQPTGRDSHEASARAASLLPRGCKP